MFILPSFLSSLTISPSLASSRTTSRLPRELNGGNFVWFPMTVSYSIALEEMRGTLLILWADIPVPQHLKNQIWLKFMWTLYPLMLCKGNDARWNQIRNQTRRRNVSCHQSCRNLLLECPRSSKLRGAQGRTICVQWASVEKKQNCHTI